MAATAAAINVPDQALLDRTAALAPKIEIFSTVSGSPVVWTKSAIAMMCRFYLIGGGAGGGNNSGSTGGGGGSSGQILVVDMHAPNIPPSLDIYIGDGGLAGFSGGNATITDENTFSLTAAGGNAGANGGAGGFSVMPPTNATGFGAGGTGGTSGIGTNGQQGPNGAGGGIGALGGNPGSGGKGYGAGGGGGGSGAGGGGGGGGGFFVYDPLNAICKQLALSGTGPTGGKGAQALVMIVTWRGVAL